MAKTSKQNIIKSALLEDFILYLRWSFKQKYNAKIILKDFHIEVCKAFVDVYLGNTKNLIINMPPRSGKTELLNIFTEWTLTKHPHSKYILTSYSDTLITNNSQSIRDMFNSQEHRNLFGITTKKDSQSKKLWKTEQGGGVYAVSSFGQITGHGAGTKQEGWGGFIGIDDPLKPSDSNSQLQLEKIKDWYETTLSNRKNSPDTPIIIIMQRLNVSDLVGHIKSNTFKDIEDWTIIEVKMYDEDKHASRWEEFYPLEKLMQMKSSNQSYFYSQMQQEPSIKGGNILKDEYWKWWKILPKLKYRFITVDTAQKKNTWNDFTVAQCWGVCLEGNIYLLDMIRIKEEAPETRRELKIFYNKHDKTVKDMGMFRSMYIEDKSSGSTIIQDFKRDRMKIKDVQRNIDKITRALDLVPYIEAGKVYINEDISYISDLLAEARGFPNFTHDDTIDPLLDAIDIGLVQANSSAVAAMMA